MRKAYFWKTLFTFDQNRENLKLLDGLNEIYEGELLNTKTIFVDTAFHQKLDKEIQNSRVVSIPIDHLNSHWQWMRISADVSIREKEWDFWKMTQFITELKDHSVTVGTYMFRVQRHMTDHETMTVFMDIRNPGRVVSSAEVKFWNGNGQKEITIRDLKAEIFDEG